MPAKKLEAEICTLQEAFPHFVDTLGGRLTREDRSLYEKTLACLSTFWDQAVAITGKTLVHGDAHFWNMLYPRDPKLDRPVLFDWQTYFVGPGTTDLAHVLVLRDPHRTGARERELVWRYYQHLVANRSIGYSWEACWLDYRRSAVEQILFPLRWHARHYTTKLGEYWDQYVEKALAAFRDLECAEFLTKSS